MGTPGNDPQPRRVHYTSPTEGGSSGSPAFDSFWQVIALHHAGGQMSRLTVKTEPIRPMREFGSKAYSGLPVGAQRMGKSGGVP